MSNESLVSTLKVVKKLIAVYARTKDESLPEMIDSLLEVALELAQEATPNWLQPIIVPTTISVQPIIPDGIYVYAAPPYIGSRGTTTDTIRVGDINVTTDDTERTK